MPSRREFLAAMPWVAAPVAAALCDPRAAAAACAAFPDANADDERFWFELQNAYTVDRGIVNLNNGGASPAPATVQAAMARHLDFVNTIPPPRALWQVQKPRLEAVRGQLARAFGADREEIALVRNASEGLQICQLGIDLARGDEVITSDRDYPRMVNTFKQRARREGIVYNQVSLRGMDDDTDAIVDAFRRGITKKTKLILTSHVVFSNGQVLPIKAIVAMAREHGVPVIVDGAHALAHVPFSLRDLECDYYATSLHKWLTAPLGTGLLYVRRDKIESLWPLMAADAKQDDDIRKFEEIGTHPYAAQLAVAEALALHQGIGAERKFDRLVRLRDRWADPLDAHDRIRVHTCRKPGRAGAIATVEIEGVEPGKLASHLWRDHRILVAAIDHPDYRGVRVSPNVYTTFDEIDRFVAAMRRVADQNLLRDKRKR